MIRALAILALASLPSAAQAPSSDEMAVTLKTMSKTLASCKAAYTRVLPSHKDPMLQELLGRENYNKDVSSLSHAQRFTDFLIAHPDKVSGSFLVMILSTSDDFSLGLQSTQTEILRHLILGDKKTTSGQQFNLSHYGFSKRLSASPS